MKISGYRLCQFYLDILFALFLVKVKLTNDDDFPQKGIILASNHFSNLDPAFLMNKLKCRTSVVAKKELFKIPFLGWFFSSLEMIPINRRAFSPGTVKLISEKLNKWNVLIFPEGTRSKTGEIGKARPGFGYMVKKMKCDVLPIFIDSFHILPKHHFFPRPGRVVIKMGRLLCFDELYDKIKMFDEKQQYIEIGNIVMNEIKALRGKDDC